MSSATLTTIIKMIELLPESKQERVVEHLREYIADLKDDIRWDILFMDTESELSTIVKNVRKEIAEGKAEDFDYGKL